MFTGSAFRPHSKIERGTMYILFEDYAVVLRTTCVPLSSVFYVLRYSKAGIPYSGIGRLAVTLKYSWPKILSVIWVTANT